ESLGRVPHDELASLYRRAAAVVFPSLYEGFGQPPLEAMACGCPVACSDAASLPEIVGDAARLFDPLSPESIAAAVRDVLAAPGEWGAKGLARASGLSWEGCTSRVTSSSRPTAGAQRRRPRARDGSPTSRCNSAFPRTSDWSTRTYSRQSRPTRPKAHETSSSTECDSPVAIT